MIMNIFSSINLQLRKGNYQGKYTLKEQYTPYWLI